MGQTLQKLGTSKSTKKTVKATHTPFINIVQTVVENQGKTPFRFLFLGETGAGKTSTIANLFQLERPTQPQVTDFIQIWKSGNNLEVIELRGLLETGSLEDDAPNLAGMVLFLREYFSREIPTMIFITARVSDSRFEGISSNFSMVLRGVKLLLPEISDSEYSNVILLLSNGKGVDNELDLRISRYQAAFHQIIEMESPVPCLAIGKDSALDDFKTILHTKSADFSPIQNFISEYISSTRPHEQFSYEGKTLKELKSDEFWGVQRKILNYIISEDFSYRDVLAPDDCTMADKTAGCDQEMLPFCSLSHIPVPDGGYEVMLPTSKILMADGFHRGIESCQVGQKVTSLSHKNGVITSIKQFGVAKTGIMVNKLIKTTYKNFNKVTMGDIVIQSKAGTKKNKKSSKWLKLQQEEGITQTLIKRGYFDEKIVSYWTYDMGTDRFELMPLKSKRLLQEVDCLYFIQIDNGDGTFVADGIVRACTTINLTGTRL